MKKNTKKPIYISIIIVIIGIIVTSIILNKKSPEVIKENLYLSLSKLENTNYYTINNNLLYGYYGNDEVDAKTIYDKEISITFDENNNITKKDTQIKEIPTTSEYIKFEEDKIIRYYGDMLKNELYVNTYYLKEWNKEELKLNEINKSTYTYINKNVYINIIKNATQIEKTKEGFTYYINKDEVKRILDKIDDNEYNLKEDILVKHVNENNKLSFIELNLETVLDTKYDYVNLVISFKTDYENDTELYLELPKIYKD